MDITNDKELWAKKEPSQHEPGAKLDLGKIDASLLQDFGLPLMLVAEVGTAGKLKYTRGGWKEVDDATNRYTAAMLRHFFSESWEDNDTDLVPYVGHPVFHAAQVAWNALARLHFIMKEKGIGSVGDLNSFWAEHLVSKSE